MPNGQELTSWKEIAAHLGVSVRTAQLWEEQRGLPVRRLPGRRGRVAADVGTIEAWKNAAPPEPKPRQFSAWALVLASALAAAVVFAASALIFRPPRPGPGSYRLDERILTVLDTQGRALWTKRFDPPVNLQAYRDPAHPRLAWFGDIDGDSHTEVLFALSRRDAGAQSALICYSDAGEERWRFSPGRMVATRKQVFHPPYSIAEIDAARHGRDGVIAVASSHHLHYPGQVAVLSAGGELRREYWHAGNLNRIALHSGRLYAAGSSDARKAATLVVLDPLRAAGASASREDDPDYRFLDMPAGGEEARILFPRSCLNRASSPYNRAVQITPRADSLAVETLESSCPIRPTIIYELDSKLSLRSVSAHEHFVIAHGKFRQSGELDHAWSPAELDELREISRLR